MQRSPVSVSDGVDLLVSGGFDVSVPPGTKTAADLLVSHEGTSALVRVKVRQKTIYEWDAHRLLESVGGDLLVIVPSASRALLEAAKSNHRLNVASVADRRLIWNGEEIRPPDSVKDSTPTSAAPSRRRIPWGRWALMRALLLDETPRSQVELAGETGVTQPAVSKSIGALDGLIVRSPSGWNASDRSVLWDRFMAEYTGPGGFTTYWYGLGPVAEQFEAVAAAVASADVQVVSSGDTAADVLAPWRILTRAVVYSRSSIPLEKLGFAQTSRERATLQFTVPADQTIWATAAAWARRTNIPIADPVIAAWDVANTGGPDAFEAVGRIRDRVLRGDQSR